MERVNIRQVRDVLPQNYWIFSNDLGGFRRKGFNLTFGIKINLINRDIRILHFTRKARVFGMLLGLFFILVNAFFFRNKGAAGIFGLAASLYNILFLLDSLGKPPWLTNLMNRRMKHL